jgi:predicted permease
MQTLLQDLRYGARMLRKNPGFTVIAIIVLGVGIGANTAIFSLFNALFLRPLPVKDAHQLVGIYGIRDGRFGEPSLSHADYLDYRGRNTVFGEVAAHANTWIWLAEGEASSEISGCLVSANYFSVLGLRPHSGRFFSPDEDETPGSHAVAVISHRLWQERFGGDQGIIGRAVRMNRVAFTVVGIAPAGFAGVYAGDNVDVWMPTMMSGMGRASGDEFSRTRTWLDIFGRLNPGRTIEEAQAEFAVLASQLEAAYPDTNKNLGVYLAPLRGLAPRNREEAASLPKLLAASVACVLLIACANIAGLLLAQSTARRKEIAIRLALGGGRARIVRQLLTESLMLSLAGATLALLIAAWTNDWIVNFYAYGLSGLKLSLDPLTVGYALILSISTVLLFGLAPALQATRPNLMMALKDEGLASGPRRSRLRSVLIVAQVALSLVLLVGAGLMIESLRNVLTNAGFDPHSIAHFRLRPGRLGYDLGRARAYHREVLRRVESVPGVESAVLLAWGTPSHGGSLVRVGLPEQPLAQPEDALRIATHEVTPGYLSTLKIALLKGREFDERDLEGTPRVAIVNETLARQMWPDRDPLGLSIMVEGNQHEVIGVAADAIPHSSDKDPEPLLYLAYWQRKLTDSRLLVRVAGNPSAMLPLLRQELLSVDADVHIGQEMSLAERTWMSFQSERLMGTTLICASLIALFLSAIGLYGIIASAVGQRTREIGIRMALGAQKADVLKLVLGQGVRLALCGIAIGMAAAFALSRVLSGFLYGVSAQNPVTLIAGALLLLFVALTACCIPAKRATKVDPIIALRCE